MTYRRKTPKIEAIQWTGDNLKEMKKFLDKGGYGCIISTLNENCLLIYEAHGLLPKAEVCKSDYIVFFLYPYRDFFGVVKADYFEEKFERVEE